MEFTAVGGAQAFPNPPLDLPQIYNKKDHLISVQAIIFNTGRSSDKTNIAPRISFHALSYVTYMDLTQYHSPTMFNSYPLGWTQFFSCSSTIN